MICRLKDSCDLFKFYYTDLGPCDMQIKSDRVIYFNSVIQIWGSVICRLEVNFVLLGTDLGHGDMQIRSDHVIFVLLGTDSGPCDMQIRSDHVIFVLLDTDSGPCDMQIRCFDVDQ